MSERNGQGGGLLLLDVVRTVQAILRDRSFTPAQAKALGAIILQANRSTGIAWCSYRQLSLEYRLGSDSIRTATRLAVANGYLAVAKRGSHGAIGYRVIAQPFPETAEQRTPSGSADEPSAPQTGALQRTPDGSADDPAHLYDGSSAPETGAIPLLDTGTTTPPTPPQAGGSARADLLVPETEAAALATVGDAYREVFGKGLPRKWRRRVKAEWQDGDRATLGEIDAPAIRGGQALAKNAKRTFGFGWVLKYLEGKAATAADNAAALETAAEVNAEADAEQQRKRKADARRVEQFRQLTAAERSTWLERVRATFPGFKRPEQIERQAAYLAAEGD